MQLMGDGWHRLRSWAEDSLKYAEELGGFPVGIILSKHGTWGLLYWGDPEVHTPNHIINEHSALAAVALKET